MKKKLNIINKFRGSIFAEYLPMFLIIIALLLVALYLLNIDSKNIVVWYGIPSKISLSGDFRFYPTNEKGRILEEQWFLAVPKDIKDIENIQKIYEIIEPRGIYKITGTRNKDDCDYYKDLNEVGNFPCVTSLTLLDIIRIGTTTAPIARTNEELCKTGTFTALLDQEIKFNQEIIEDKFIQHLRLAIDDFLDKKYEEIKACGGYYGFFQEKHCEDSAYNPTTGPVLFLDNLNFLRSKFIIFQTDIAPGGGESMILMFKDKPDQIFYAWVYGNNNDYYDLRGFYEYNHNEPDISEVQKVFINQLCSQKAGI